jgi:hypothetical protein
MAEDDDNPLEGKEFNDALAKLQGSPPEMQAIATLISELRDAVVELQEQMGDDDDDDDDDKD